jgi:hypothetical protein
MAGAPRLSGPPHHTASALAHAPPVVCTAARVSPPTHTAASPNPPHHTPPTRPPTAGPHPPSPTHLSRASCHSSRTHPSAIDGGEGGIAGAPRVSGRPHHPASTLAPTPAVDRATARVSPPTHTAARPNPPHHAPPARPSLAVSHPPSPTLLFHASYHSSATHPSATDGGEGGIRTRGTVTRTHAFQACSFSHSDTSPRGPPPFPTHCRPTRLAGHPTSASSHPPSRTSLSRRSCHFRVARPSASHGGEGGI